MVDESIILYVDLFSHVLFMTLDTFRMDFANTLAGKHARIQLVPFSCLHSFATVRCLSQWTSSVCGLIQAPIKKTKGNEVKNRGPLQPVVDMVPSNFFNSASSNRNMLQVVFMAIFIGIGLIQIPKEKGKPVHDFFESLNEIVIKLVDIIMLMAPIGVFSLIAQTINKVAGNNPSEI